MEQANTNDENPPIPFLSVENERGNLKVKHQCPFLGLDHDPETVMSFPFHLNHCHRIKPAQKVRLDYQNTHCLTFAHRHCPALLDPSIKSLPPDIAATTTKRRTIFVLLSSASIIFVLVVAFLLFGSRWATSASEPPFALDSEHTQQDIGDLQASPEQPIATEEQSLFIPLMENSAPTAESTNTLVPPTWTSTPQSAPISQATSTPTVQNCSPPAGWVIYTVRPGDTLLSISQATNVTVAELREANCLDNSSSIRTGQQLYVPFIPSPSSTPTLLPTQALTPELTQLPTNTPTLDPPTVTPDPTQTSTSQPTEPPVPFFTATPAATSTPMDTPTVVISQPTETPVPLFTATPAATITPSDTLPTSVLTPTGAPSD